MGVNPCQIGSRNPATFCPSPLSRLKKTTQLATTGGHSYSVSPRTFPPSSPIGVMDVNPSSDHPLDFGKMDHGRVTSSSPDFLSFFLFLFSFLLMDSDLGLRICDLLVYIYRCKHYRRRCKIRAPCCNEVYTCRHCHNEAVSALNDVKKHHELVRQDVRQVVCLICDTEQPVAQVCTNCGVKMGEYFCDICKFYEDDTEKMQFHCHECGICRVGGRENFFHCRKCGSCYSTGLLDNHLCVENSMQHHCSICYEYLFDSLKETTVLKCGHTMHSECFDEMRMRNQYTCPICFKSAVDMSRHWKKLEIEVQETLMPEDYRDKKVWILCNDCSHTSEVFYHIIGHQCRHCSSFNTRNTSAPARPQ